MSETITKELQNPEVFREIKKRFQIKAPIRLKFILIFFLLNIAISAGSSYVIYQKSYSLFLKSFLSSKLLLTNFIASIASAEDLAKWSGGDVAKELEFFEFSNVLKRIVEQEENVKYIFTIFYDPNIKRFVYVNSGGVASEEMIFIENWNFALQIVFQDGAPRFQWNEKLYDDSVTLGKSKDLKFSIRFADGYYNIFLNEELLFKTNYKTKTEIYSNSGQLLQNGKRHFLSSAKNAFEPIQFYHLEKGEFDVPPGALFYNNPTFNNLLEIGLKENISKIGSDFTKLNLGNYINSIVSIQDKSGKSVGYVVMKISEDDIRAFNQTILFSTLLITFATFVITFILVSIVTILVTRPIKILKDSVNAISEGNLNHKVRIRSRDEFGELASSFNHMTSMLRTASKKIRDYAANLEIKVKERTEELTKALSEINSDLLVAKKIQKNVLPETVQNFPTLLSVNLYRAMSEVGGDFIDVCQIEPNRFRAFIADATGHGVQAALITMVIKSEYENLKRWELPIGEIIEKLNSIFYQRYTSLNTYFTCAMAEINTQTKTIHFASAGHPPQLVISEDGNIAELLPTGPLMGAKKSVAYRTTEHKIQNGDKIFFFSDGIFEEFNEALEEFGEGRLYETLTTNRNLPVKEIPQKTVEVVQSFIGQGKPFKDDVTMIVMELT